MNPTARAVVLPRPAANPPAWAYALVFSAGAGLAVFIACQLEAHVIPFAGCGVKHLTGLPCPGCGGTRSLAALAQLDLLRAFAMNPLAAAVVVMAPLSVPVAFVDATFNCGRAVRRLSQFCRDRKFTWLLGALMGVNWIYLLFAGR